MRKILFYVMLLSSVLCWNACAPDDPVEEEDDDKEIVRPPWLDDDYDDGKDDDDDDKDPIIPTPDDPTEIPDEDVPLANIPKTGDTSALWMALSALSGVGLAGMLFLGRNKKREEI